MNRLLPIVLLLCLAANAQPTARAVWRSVHSSTSPILSTTESTNAVANPYASGGKEHPMLSLFCIDSTATIEFRGSFQLRQPIAGVNIDGETWPVDWTVSDDRESMTASKSDVQSLSAMMRHGKQMLVFFQTTGGPSQTATFSLAGLNALMNRTGCN